MPYKNISEAEEKNPGLKKYSDKAKRGWIGSFNSCMADGGPEDKCFAIAFSVANKVDGRKPKKSSLDWAEMNSRMKERRDPDGIEGEWVDRELIAAFEDIEAANSIAMSFVNEAKAVKMRAFVMNFFGDVKKFKGNLNEFLKKLPSMVDNPRALAEFPELENIIGLSKFMGKNVMRDVMISPRDLTQKMMKVITVDAR